MFEEKEKKTQEVQGVVVQLQHFSLHDGDGIRTTLFLAGCPLRCRWCANPESWEQTPLKAPGTGKILRRWMQVEEILSEVRRQMIFYRASGGGVTYSGGEPTVQLGFLRSLVDAMSHLGIHQAMETCGFFSWEAAGDILQKMDAIFVDVKVMDPLAHKELTGVDNRLILANIKKMSRLNIPLVIRIPLIPDVNDHEENLKALADFIRNQVPESSVELLPYHTLGLEKHKQLGLQSPQYGYRPPTHDERKRSAAIFEKAGISVICY
ncbi:glycyl-radical enzyme activating protein [Anoxynatronum buryatiense]|uniref:Pyruvate formate lyase activating enzyme n=1 Tax=Anoxynatronum buryatiense TaxID=489973 RepID=A0AA45WZ47_9CLOT|nr:glycyl-radical enzyme activating protein [Anoxynatronum buryatiense]SMP72180.1 pyruvate formate lyase activating enzyme [Anoxynatronum buryatiense]